MSKTDPSKAAQDNRANQLNPTHPAYHRSRGASEGEAADQAAHSKPALDNRANSTRTTRPTSPRGARAGTRDASPG